MVIHSVFLPGESLWTKEPGGLQSMWLQRVRHDWATKCTRTHTHTHTHTHTTKRSTLLTIVVMLRMHLQSVIILTGSLYLLTTFIYLSSPTNLMSSVVFFRFHMSVRSYTICILFLPYFTWYNSFKLHPCCYKWQDFFLFNGWLIFYCVYIPFFSLFIHQLMDM